MNTSVPPELLAAARAGVVHYTLVQRVARDSSRPAPEILDELAHFVATQFAAGQMPYEEADTIMNALWSVCVSEEFWAEYDRTIPEATREVFEAFDAGEYNHQGDGPDVDPVEKYTKPLIAAYLSEHNGA